MDYHKHYTMLVERAKTRHIDGYTEKHHITPKCLSGTNDKNNLVSLTPEEHFLAHKLLVKMHPGNAKLVYAAHKMCQGRTTNKLYGWLRREFIKTVSNRVVSTETRAKFSKLWSGQGNPMYGKPSPRGMKGKKMSSESKAKQSVSIKKSWANAECRRSAQSARMCGNSYGANVTQEIKDRWSKERSGQGNPMYGKSAVKNRKWMINRSTKVVQLVVPTEVERLLKDGWEFGRR